MFVNTCIIKYVYSFFGVVALNGSTQDILFLAQGKLEDSRFLVCGVLLGK
jgi:hypothetical protein